LVLEKADTIMSQETLLDQTKSFYQECDKNDIKNDPKIQNMQKKVNKFQKYKVQNQIQNSTSKIKEGAFKDVNDQLSKEIEQYVQWVDSFQIQAIPFIENVFKLLKAKILQFFNKDIEVI